MTKEPICQRCKYTLVPGARFCHYCGQEQDRRLASPGRKACPSCRGGVIAGASFCAWCGRDLSGPGKVLETLEGWHFDWSCPACGGNVVCTMEHCPSCGHALRLKLAGDEKCRHCGRFYHPGWYFCASCGGMLEPFLYLPDYKRKMVFTPQALYLMCQAAVERYNQGRGPRGKGKGLEALGLLLGERKAGEFRVRHVYPLVSAAVGPKMARAVTSNMGPMRKLDAICGAGLKFLGIFHSHTDGTSKPSQGDRKYWEAGELNVIVGVGTARRSRAWECEPISGGLEGAAGDLKFSIAAFRMGKDGVVRGVAVERGDIKVGRAR